MEESKKTEQLDIRTKARLLTGKSFWNTAECKELGLPSVKLSDGPHGMRVQAKRPNHLGLGTSLPATCLPTASAVACSFDEELCENFIMPDPFDPRVADAVAAAEAGRKCVLVRWETNPDDLAGMIAAEGILTSHGGKTSHAAVIARGMGAPCVCGVEALKIDAAKKEAEYEDKVADKVKQIAKLQEQINALSLDDSRDAQAKKIKLEEEMAELQKKISGETDFLMRYPEECVDMDEEGERNFLKERQDSNDSLILV